MDEWKRSVNTDGRDLTFRADDFGCEAASKRCLWSPIIKARAASVVVAKMIVPNNMALAMVVIGATAAGS